MGAVRVYTVCDETRSKKELFILTNRFGSLIDVNQWMQKTVRSLLMSIGSSSVSSPMQGFASFFSFDLQIPFLF